MKHIQQSLVEAMVSCVERSQLVLLSLQNGLLLNHFLFALGWKPVILLFPEFTLYALGKPRTALPVSGLLAFVLFSGSDATKEVSQALWVLWGTPASDA